MKRLRRIGSILMGLACTISGYAQDSIATAGNAGTLRLSREQCLQIALDNSPTIKVADLEIKRMDYSKKETVASLFPSLDFSGAYQRAIELQTISMNMNGQSMPIKMGRDNTWNFSFSVSLPIIAPTLWKAIQISDTQILSTLESARSSRLDMCNNVNKAYYALLLANASYQVLKENYEITKFNAELYEKQFAAGTASEYDVLRSSVQLKNLEPQLLEAEIGIKQCKMQLKVLMGMDVNQDIDASVTLKEMQQDMYGYSMSLDRSLRDNSSLRSLDIQRKLVGQNVELKKLAWAPTLGAQYSYAWSAMSDGNPLKNQTFYPYSSVSLALSVPLLSGGSRYWGLQGAKLQAAELDLQRENLVSALDMQVDLALDNINREVKQIGTSAEGVRQAEKAHQIMQKSFEIGAATYLNLLDSELAETSAKLSYYQAIYNYLVSTSDLDLLLGRDAALEPEGYIDPNNSRN